MNDPFVKEPRKKQPQQINGDGGNGGLRRHIFAVDVVDPPHLRIRMNKFGGNFGDRELHSRQYLALAPERQGELEGVEPAGCGSPA